MLAILTPPLCGLGYPVSSGRVRIDDGRLLMKIYLFNPETGVYLGEDFADEAALRRGAWVVPSDATVIAPPTAGSGQVLVFDRAEQRWQVRQVPVVEVRNL
jgi:hypothetical protein